MTRNEQKFAWYSGWVVAAIMGIVAFLGELNREIAIEHAGLLRANLNSYKSRLLMLEAALKTQQQQYPEKDPFSHVGIAPTD